LLLAADGGLRHCLAMGRAPDRLIGDFDSLAPLDSARFLAGPDGRPRFPVTRLPPEKDETDMLAAIRFGWDAGCRRFVLCGGTGGRLDHTFANLQCLAELAQKGGEGYLLDEACAITALYRGTLVFPEGAQGCVSVFAQGGPARGVTLEGLKYPLRDARLTPSFPLGVSNALTGQPARVTVREGTVLVFFPRQILEDITRLEQRA
jgi:thiamine pyrophosphokinase